MGQINITPVDDNYLEHGCWLNIDRYGQLVFKGVFIHGFEYGFWVESRFVKCYYAR